MNVAKWLLLTLLTLPFLELALFVAVAAAIGFVWALGLVLAGSLAGASMLRSAGGTHIGRVRVALSEGSFTALQADSSGSLVLLAGILLLIPGFITDVIALFVLAAWLRRILSGAAAGCRPAATVSWIFRLSSGITCQTPPCPTAQTVLGVPMVQNPRGLITDLC